VQVGPPAAGTQGQVSKAVGLPLEIVPDANPYGTPRPAILPVHVIYAGHPLAGALVKLTNLENAELINLSQGGAFMHRHMLAFVTLNLILGVVLTRVMRIPLVVGVSSVHLYDRAAHMTRFGVPAHMIAHFEFLDHEISRLKDFAGP
jgi:hypothetical protein